jgi:hypothetical protein
MPGLSPKVGIGVNRKSALSWSSYWTKLNPILWVKENSRSGLTLTDSVNPANSPTILPACLKNSTAGEVNQYVADNGALNLDNTKFNYLGGWIKPEFTSKLEYWRIMGKDIAGAPDGCYYFVTNVTDGKLYCVVRSSGGVVSLPKSTDFTAMGWAHVLLEIDTTTKKARWYLNNSQVGSDSSYTGTFAALGNQYEFNLGAQNIADGSGWMAANKAACSFADIFMLKRDTQMTPTERANLLLGIVPNDCAGHWPCNTISPYDVSGNGLHLTPTYVDTNYLLDSSNIVFASCGSIHCLNVGYSLYTKIGCRDIQVPYIISGSPINTPPNIPTGYVFSKNVLGDLLNHNLSDSKLQFAGAEWDRSDVSLFNTSARAVYYSHNCLYYDATSATTKKQWHISELNKNRMNAMCVQTNYGRNWVRGSGNTIDNRVDLREIAAFATSLSGSDYIKLIGWARDTGKSYYLEYYFESLDVCTTRGKKILIFDPVAKLLKLSIDNGATYPYTMSTNGILTLVQRAHIYSNGNILFAQNDKCWYSMDNLATYHESTVTGEDGNPFVPSAVDNFRCTAEIQYLSIYGYDDFDLFGTYSTTTDPQDVNINLWITKDSGVTLKSIFKAGVTLVGGATKTMRHIHAITYFPDTDEFVLTSGDTGTDSHWIRGKYNSITDVWTWTLMASGADYSVPSLHQYDGYVYWAGDASAWVGIWRCLYADILDNTKWERISATSLINKRDTNGPFDDMNGMMIEQDLYVNSGDIACYHITIDRGKTWIRHDFVHSITFTTYGGFYPITPAKDDGYMKAEIQESTETLPIYEGGQTLMFRIVKS